MRHALVIQDMFEGEGAHLFEIPLHLAPGVEAEQVCEGILTLRSGERNFTLTWDDAREWELRIGKGRISPSYGVSVSGTRLSWHRKGLPDTPLLVSIVHENTNPY